MRQARIQSSFKFFIGIGLLYFSFIAIFTTSVNAQYGATPLSLAKGRSANSYQISDIENIDYFTGRVNISIPLAGLQGRGEVGYSISANISSPSWTAGVEENDGSPRVAAQHDGMVGKITRFPEIVARMSIGYSDTVSCYGSPYLQYTVTRFYVTMGDGSEHELRDTLTDGQPLSMPNCNTHPNRGKVFVSKDGSDMMYVNDNDVHDDGIFTGNGYLILKNGTTYKYDNGAPKLTDRNGNFISFTSGIENGVAVNHITDANGRDISIQSEPSVWGSFKYKGVGGQQRQTSVITATLHNVLATGETLQTHMQLFGVFPGGSYDYQFDPVVISAVTLPNGQSYNFKYNSYGEIARIEFPTGSAVEYTWAPGIDGATNGGLNNNTSNPYIYRRVIERRQYDDGVNLTKKMTISRPESLSGWSINNQGYVDIKTYAPAQLPAFERHFYYDQASNNFQYGGGYTPWKTGKEYRTEILSTQNSSILRATEMTWQQTNANWFANYGDNAPVNNPQIVQTTTTLGDSNQVSKTTFTYDSRNNLTDTYEYDYGTGTPGQFLRRSHTDYLTTNPVSNIDYTSNSIHILGLPSEKWISSDTAGNNKVSRIKFEYDNYATDQNHAALLDRSNITGHNSSYGTSYVTRGNVTKITSYADAQNQTGAVSSYRQYDIAGNPVKGIDAKGFINTLDYSDRFGTSDAEARNNSASPLGGQQTFAFATSATNAVGYTTYSQFDYYTGVVVDSEDINGNVSTTYYNSNDPLDRPAQVISANNRSQFRKQTTFNYDDVYRIVTITSDSKVFNDNLLKTESYYDKMGRTVETREYETSSNYIATQQQYDALGRADKSSNPFRPYLSEQVQWTETSFDALGRVEQVKTPDNAITSRSYYGSTTTVTDQFLRKRSGTSDAIGRLLKVNEDPNGVNYETTYQYDVLGRLRKTTQIDGQITQNRYFMYNDLGRLIRAKQPEQDTNSSLSVSDPITGNSNWSVSYSYDNNGNLTSTTDANNRTITGTYDNLNRLIFRDYGDSTPDVTFTFDDVNIANSKAQLTAIASTVSSTNYTSFDYLGRVKSSSQTTGGQTYNMSDYTYDLSGALVAQTYPSGRVVTTETDNIGRLSKVLSQMPGQNQRTYAGNLSYNSVGGVEKMRLGNGVWESAQFDNKRLQIRQIGLGASSGDTSYLKLEYDYGNADNNGSLRQQKITVQGMTAPLVQNYTYDSLNRLKSATENVNGNPTTTWKQTFDYDKFGNRRFDAGNTTTLPANNGVYNPQIDKNKNRFTVAEGYNYDAEGNLTSNPESQLFAYDSENRQIQVQSSSGTANYYYDGSGKRVKKAVGTQETIFVYDAFAKLVAEYTTNQAITTKGTQYLTPDALGSPRAITNNYGRVVSRHDYMPFGEEVSGGTGGRTSTQGYLTTSDGVRQQFTGYERDIESGLDYAQARYFSSKHGRFTSADPLAASADVKNPQSLNRYTYGLNSPYKFVDPLGLSSECQGPGGGSNVTTLASCDRGENTSGASNQNNCEGNKPCEAIPPPPKLNIVIQQTDKNGVKTQRPLSKAEQKIADELVKKNWEIIYNTALNTGSRTNQPKDEVTETTKGTSETGKADIEVSNSGVKVGGGGSSTTNVAEKSTGVRSLEDRLNDNKNYLNNNAIAISAFDKHISNSAEFVGIINGQLRQGATRLIEGASQSPRLPDEQYQRSISDGQMNRPPRVGPFPVYDQIPRPY